MSLKAIVVVISMLVTSLSFAGNQPPCPTDRYQLKESVISKFKGRFWLSSQRGKDRKTTKEFCELLRGSSSSCVYSDEYGSVEILYTDNYLCTMETTRWGKSARMAINAVVTYETGTEALFLGGLAFSKQVCEAIETHPDAVLDRELYKINGKIVSKEDAEKAGTYTSEIRNKVSVGKMNVRCTTTSNHKDGSREPQYHNSELLKD